MKRIAAGLGLSALLALLVPLHAQGGPVDEGGEPLYSATVRADAPVAPAPAFVRRSSAPQGIVVSRPITPGRVAFVAAPGNGDGGDHRVVAALGLALGVAAGAGVVAVARARTSRTGPTTEGGTS